MNKLLPFALALALALPGCAAGNTAPQPPETPTTTTETAAEAQAESTLPGLAGRLRQTSYDTAVGQTFYGMMSTYDEETLTSVYTIIATDTDGQHPAESGRAGDPGLLYQSGRLAGRLGTVH